MSKASVYSKEQAANIKKEFSRLQDVCYLDHAGATLYSEKQMEDIFADFSKNLYGNPHAHNTTSEVTQDIIDIVRYRILEFFHTSSEQYSVIFSSGATQSLKIVAESFDFKGGSLVYLEDNHTSVLGMRTLAPDFRELKVSEALNILSVAPGSKNRGRHEKAEENCLFVYPAQSNFSGTKYPLEWIEEVQKGALNTKGRQNFYTLLDAACSNDLNIGGNFQPDFIAISFYKIFGYPTGLGALLVKKNSESVLKKKYLGGGTVLMALSSENVMIPRGNLYERFEDGTLPFLSIMSLVQGFETFKRLQITPSLVSKHTFNLSHYVYDQLSVLKHSNGQPLAELYHDFDYQSLKTQGGIVNFNLKRSNSDYVGYAEVLHMANLHGIQLRTGCFCNPGACQRFLHLSPAEVRKHFQAGHVCGDQQDLVDGRPTGSVRVSFGYMSTFEDADRFLEMISKCFLHFPVIRNIIQLGNEEQSKPLIEHKPILQNVTGRLARIYLYPVKSGGPFQVKQSWKLTNIGLEYDRRWMIVNALGSCVSQKDIKSLCTLKPILDFDNRTLRLQINDSQITLPLDPSEENDDYCNSKVCGDRVQGYDCGDKVAEWLSDHLKKPGLRLLRQSDFTGSMSGRNSKLGKQTFLSLANKAEYLLVNLATVRWLRERIPQEDVLCHSVESVLLRFRANFVVDFAKPFAENDLAIILFNDVPFKFAGLCTRCQMICIDQQTGEISREPLQTLSKEMGGKMRFGIYLSRMQPKEDCRVTPGCAVIGLSQNHEVKNETL